MVRKQLTKNLELLFWISGLIYLFLISPIEEHFSFCPLNNLGFKWCPGCGLGKSISYLFHFQIIQSLETHPLGIFAFIIISYRIITLIKNFRREHYGKYLNLPSRN
ncbi:MAG: DUF2752 domain-containing protein [Ignavibacteria bacterium]